MSWALLVLTVGAVTPCLLATLHDDPLRRLAGLEALSAVVTVDILLYALVVGRTAYLDVGLVLALLSFAGTLVFARFFGRTL